jgi:hypothetical protein
MNGFDGRNRSSDDEGHADGLHGKLEQWVVLGFHGWISWDLRGLSRVLAGLEGFGCTTQMRRP